METVNIIDSSLSCDKDILLSDFQLKKGEEERSWLVTTSKKGKKKKEKNFKGEL